MRYFFLFATLYLVAAGCATRPVLTEEEVAEAEYAHVEKIMLEREELRSYLLSCKAANYALFMNTKMLSRHALAKFNSRRNEAFAFIPRQLKRHDVQCLSPEAAKRLMDQLLSGY